MKKTLSFVLIAIYLMVPGKTFAHSHDDSQEIEEVIGSFAEITS